MNLRRDSSVFYFYEAVPLLLKKPKNKVLLHIYHSMANYYSDKNKVDSALKYATLAIETGKDSTQYSDIDNILPAYNYAKLLKSIGRDDESENVMRGVMINQYNVKLDAINFPEINKRIPYLEYLRNNQKIRFVILLSVSISALIILFIFIYLNFRLRKKENELSKSLQENETLFNEANHRVKNNYQMMMSMLTPLYNSTIQSTDQFIELTRAKIASMAKVHELFLQTARDHQIDANTYFQEIIQSLDHSLSLQQKNININFKNCEYQLKTNVIVTLGLIINELIINAVKYAFDDQASGKIEFSLQKKGDSYTMFYNDNGIGFNNDKMHTGSGMAIVFSLAKQLRGEAVIRNDKGTLIEVNFIA
jgi:hypothetical protein